MYPSNAHFLVSILLYKAWLLIGVDLSDIDSASRNSDEQSGIATSEWEVNGVCHSDMHDVVAVESSSGDLDAVHGHKSRQFCDLHDPVGAGEYISERALHSGCLVGSGRTSA